MSGYAYDPGPAKCFVAFQRPDGAIIVYQGWATDVSIDHTRSMSYFHPDLEMPFFMDCGDTTVQIEITMINPHTVMQAETPAPQWADIHAPAEIENRKEIEE